MPPPRPRPNESGHLPISHQTSRTQLQGGHESASTNLELTSENRRPIRIHRYRCENIVIGSSALTNTWAQMKCTLQQHHQKINTQKQASEVGAEKPGFRLEPLSKQPTSRKLRHLKF